MLIRIFPQTALHLAVITEQPLVVERLLKAGCDPMLVDNNGNTALHIACRTGSLTCFGLLTQNCLEYLPSILQMPNYSGELQPRACQSVRSHSHERIKMKIRSALISSNVTRFKLCEMITLSEKLYFVFPQVRNAYTWWPHTAFCHWWRISSIWEQISMNR